MVYINETVDEDAENCTNATGSTDVIKLNNDTGVPTNITVSNGTPTIFFAGTVAVGVMGLLSNGVVLIMMCFKRDFGRNLCNALIHNQTIIDISASLFLVIMYAAKLHGIQLTGSWGRFYCKLFDSNAMYATGINASTAGLMVISVERYTKIVHSVLYRVRFRPWMKHVAMVFPWIYSVLISFPIPMAMSDISDGRCIPSNNWSADWLRAAYGFGTFIWKFLLPLGVFVFCYAKIFLLIKAQSKVHAPHSTNNGENLLSRSEKNILKTLLFVVGCFAVAYAPLYFLMLFAALQMQCCTLSSNSFLFSIWISNLNIVINPFIYASKSEMVETLVSKIRKRITHQNEQTSKVAPFTINT